MTITELNNKWALLSDYESNNGFKSLRITSECISDIFIGIDKYSNRCLILALPIDFKFNFKSVVKENLTIEYYDEKNLIVLKLTDNTFYDLFDDLILSLYQRINTISNADQYSKEFVQTFFKWSEFFDDKISNLLTENIVKGLFGELLVLKNMIIKFDSIFVNNVLESWKGPYDKGHDFELDDKDIEVKTKDHSKLDIQISSEFQLEKSLDKKLELFVVSVIKDNSGLCLTNLVEEIRNLILNSLGDSFIFLKALNQKGLTFKNLNIYDNFKYTPINQIVYDCNEATFPKIIRSNLPKEINSVNYSVRISALSDYIISKKEF